MSLHRCYLRAVLLEKEEALLRKMELPQEPMRNLRATFPRNHSHHIPPASMTCKAHFIICLSEIKTK